MRTLITALLFLVVTSASAQGWSNTGDFYLLDEDTEPQPIARYDCEDLTGGTLVNQVGADDLQQTGAGTFAQVTSFGSYGNACSCTGLSSYVAASSSVFNFTDSFTVLTAYNVDTSTLDEIMFGKASSISVVANIQYMGWRNHINSSNEQYQGTISNGSSSAETASHLVHTIDTQWHGYGVVFDNANDSLKAYVDQDFQFVTTSLVPQSSSQIFEVCELNGDFDELEIFDVALTHEQIVDWMIERGF